MTDTSNTGQNRKPGTFVKGDPRINRKGRPKSFDAVRELAQQIAHEVAKSKGVEVVYDGHIVTVTEAILRQWATSKDGKQQQAFMEYAYGKPQTRVELSGKDGSDTINIVIKYADADSNATPSA